jgi:hypothetical protein
MVGAFDGRILAAPPILVTADHPHRDGGVDATCGRLCRTFSIPAGASTAASLRAPQGGCRCEACAASCVAVGRLSADRIAHRSAASAPVGRGAASAALSSLLPRARTPVPCRRPGHHPANLRLAALRSWKEHER